MSATIEATVVETESAPAGDASFAETVARLVARAGGSLPWSALEPAALILAREGLLTCPEITFGCGYDLAIRSHELRRGFVRAMSDGLVDADGDRVWLLARGRAVAGDALDKPAAAVFTLPPAELAQRARRLLLDD